jgi:hypothetical protein
MTRWIQEFNQSQFKSTWSALLSSVTNLSADDQTINTTVEELARLKKVIFFVNSIIENSDLELTPKSIWVNCNSQADACFGQVNAYISNRNDAHLIQANDHADNLLTYVRPYMVSPELALKAYGEAVKAFSKQISEHAKSFQKKATEITNDLNKIKDEAVEKKLEIDTAEQRIKQFDAYLFEGTNENTPAEEYINKILKESSESHKKIADIHQSVAEGPESIIARITGYEKQISTINETLSGLLNHAAPKYNEFNSYYDKIFGTKPGDDDEIYEGGLKNELTERIRQLEQYDADQKTRHSALFKSIESLLPGATSAGLASAYKSLRDRFKTPIIGYTIAFYGALIILLISGLLLVSESFTLWPLHIEFVKAGDWQEMLRTLLTRTPIVIPVVWLAIFSATRRSQYERLQQEYAHKEAIASSYESYKKQLQELKIDTDELQKELISNAINAISYNASKTLDGKHIETPPIAHLLEKLNLEEVKKLIDLIKGK